MTALQAGDADAFDAVVAEFQRPLFTFAWRYLQNGADAEDIAVEVFVRLHQTLPRLRSDTNLSAWLFTAAANLCHNRHRWRVRHATASLDAPLAAAAPELIAPAGGPEAALEQDEASSALRTAIDRLPHDQRTVVLLHHYEHLSYREIAAVVGCSERGVETRLYRARQNLRVDLAGFFHETIAS